MTRQRALLLVMVIVLLSSFSGSLSLMVGMNLGYQLGRNIFQWVSIIIYSLPILTYPIFSVWSDSLGRRPFILISMISKLVETIIIASADSVVLLAFAQICGSATNWAMIGSMTYIADLTTSKNRAEVLITLGAVSTVGFAAGTSLSSYAFEFPRGIMLYSNAAIMLITIAITYFALPESLKEENRTPLHWKDANIFGTTKALFTNGRTISLLVVSYCLILLAAHAVRVVRFWYMLDEERQNRAAAGMSSMAQNMFAVLIAGFMVLIIPLIGRSKTAIVGIVVSMIGASIYAFVPLPVLRTVILLPLFSSMATSIVMALMSEKTGPRRHGMIIGGLMSLASAFSVLASQNSAWFGYLKENTPQLTFLTVVVPAAIFLLGVLPFISIPKEERA